MQTEIQMYEKLQYMYSWCHACIPFLCFDIQSLDAKVGKVLRLSFVFTVQEQQMAGVKSSSDSQCTTLVALSPEDVHELRTPTMKSRPHLVLANPHQFIYKHNIRRSNLSEVRLLPTPTIMTCRGTLLIQFPVGEICDTVRSSGCGYSLCDDGRQQQCYGSSEKEPQEGKRLQSWGCPNKSEFSGGSHCPSVFDQYADLDTGKTSCGCKNNLVECSDRYASLKVTSPNTSSRLLSSAPAPSPSPASSVQSEPLPPPPQTFQTHVSSSPSLQSSTQSFNHQPTIPSSSHSSSFTISPSLSSSSPGLLPTTPSPNPQPPSFTPSSPSNPPPTFTTATLAGIIVGSIAGLAFIAVFIWLLLSHLGVVRGRRAVNEDIVVTEPPPPPYWRVEEGERDCETERGERMGDRAGVVHELGTEVGPFEMKS
ncbi:hypothetical protein B0J11DRAFT_511281 [Dendryphion nanum]|uniref:Uncharacterized protein n=1 Tax=Dendryphion nanum TaxID=256645 RepID=A0A9P9D723_9PLEO|nr:hypothetical protein B0J11DRAFT_511281 [Dendryphion nanum]